MPESKRDPTEVSRDFFKNLVEDEEVDRHAKIDIAVSMFDCSTLLKHLKKTTALAGAGLTRVSPADSFSYIVLRIMRPELFPDPADAPKEDDDAISD